MATSSQSIPRKGRNSLNSLKTLPKLIAETQVICNEYIRERDSTIFGKCISCNSKITQAGHRFPTSTHNGMRFLPENIHGQEISCNHFKSGNLDEYDKGLFNRFGKEYIESLKLKEKMYKRISYKFNRFDVISIKETYKKLLKEKIWIFTWEEFNKYRYE